MFRGKKTHAGVVDPEWTAPTWQELGEAGLYQCLHNRGIDIASATQEIGASQEDASGPKYYIAPARSATDHPSGGLGMADRMSQIGRQRIPQRVTTASPASSTAQNSA